MTTLTAEAYGKLPYDVREFIYRLQRDECSSNQADHRPTSQATLDDIEQAALTKYNNYLAWWNSGTESERAEREQQAEWCAKLHEHFQKKERGYTGYDTHKPVSMKLNGVWMLAPRCFLWWEDVTIIKGVILGGVK